MPATRLRLTLLDLGTQVPKDMAPGETIEIPLELARPIVIGRDPMVEVLVSAPSVGRQVVRLTPEPEGIRIEDLGSGGGSALDVEGVLERRPRRYLPNQAVLWIGEVAFRVQVDDPDRLPQDENVCDLGMQGTARVVRRVHAGACFDVFALDAGGRPLCLKLVSERAGPAQGGAPAVFGATRLVGGVSTVWDVICNAGEAVGLAVGAGARAGRYAPASAESLLEAEADRIRASCGRWNHAIVDVVRCTMGDRPGALGLLMPWHPGPTLESLPDAEKRRLLPRMMPALWDALAAAPHGDLHGSNLLVSPAADRFVLIDPGVAVLKDLGSDCAISSVLAMTFVTNPETYPILPPYYSPTRALSEGATLADHWASFVQSLTGGFLGTIARPEGEPHPADLLAVGIIYYRALARDHPFYDEHFSRPGWVGTESVDDHVTGAELATARLGRGVTAPSAFNPLVQGAEDELALALLNLQVLQRQQLVELARAAALAAEASSH